MFLGGYPLRGHSIASACNRDGPLPGRGANQPNRRRSGFFFRASSGRDQSFCRAQLTARAIQYPSRFVEVASFEQQQGDFDTAAGAVERVLHLGRAAAGKLEQDVFAAPGQLLVDRFEVDHQTAINAAEPDHDQGRQQIQRDPLSGAGLHAGRPGDRLGTGIEPYRMLGLGEQRCVAVVGDGDGKGSALFLPLADRRG